MNKAYVLTALRVVLILGLAVETAAYFMGAGAVVWVAGLLTIGIAITGQTVESSRRRPTGGAR